MKRLIVAVMAVLFLGGLGLAGADTKVSGTPTVAAAVTPAVTPVKKAKEAGKKKAVKAKKVEKKEAASTTPVVSATPAAK